GTRLPCRLRQCDVRQAERGRIAPQTGDAVEEYLVGSPRQERRQQSIFVGARRIDLVGFGWLAIEVRSQYRAVHAGDRLNRKYTLGGDSRPIRYRGLRYANLTRKPPNTPSRRNRFIETGVPHVSLPQYFRVKFCDPKVCPVNSRSLCIIAYFGRA